MKKILHKSYRITSQLGEKEQEMYQNFSGFKSEIVFFF